MAKPKTKSVKKTPPKKAPAKKTAAPAKKTAAPARKRPAGVPAAAVFNAAENEWELGTTKGGVSVGEWTWWRPDGTLVCRSTYDDKGALHGVSRRHHPDGSLSMESRYVHGVRWGKTRHTRSLRGGSPEDAHMAPVPAHVFELSMVYNAGDVLLVSMLNEHGAKSPPKSQGGWFADLTREIPKFVPGTAFMALGTLLDVADRRVDVPVLFYDGPALADHSVLRFSFAPPGARKSKVPAWQDPTYGTAISLDEAKEKLVLAVDLLDALFAPGREPPALGFTIELHEGVFSLNKVPRGGLAEKAGLRAGDVIKTINGRRITGPADYIAGRREVAEKRRLSLGVERGGKKIKADFAVS